MLFLSLLSLVLGLGGLSLTNVSQASASHITSQVPKAYRHKWHGWDGDWFKLTKHHLSAGYLNQKNTNTRVKFSRVYTKRHIRIYTQNATGYDLKLKHIKSSFYHDKHQHWYLNIRTLGQKYAIQYRK